MEPLRLFGIPISGVGYGMNWMLTNAQIELLAADVSVVDYNYGDKKGKKNTYDADPEDVEARAKEWEEKYKGKPTGGIDLGLADYESVGISGIK